MTEQTLAIKLPQAASSRQYWGNLPGSSLGLAISMAAQANNGITVVITPDTATAMRLEQELPVFLEDNDNPILHFPDWETLPYDSFSPHQDIISQRLQTLYQLPQTARGILITPHH